MNKLHLILFFLFLSSQILAVNSLREENEGAPFITSTKDGQSLTNTLRVETNGSNGTTSSKPFTLFLPVNSTDGGVNNNTFSSLTNRSVLASIVNGSEDTSPDALNFRFLVDINTDTVNQFVVFAVKLSDGTFNVVKRTLVTTSGAASHSVTLGEICKEEADCTKVTTTSTLSGSITVNMHVAVAKSPNDVGGSFDPAAVNTGIFYDLKISNTAKNNDTISFDSLLKGDEQLLATFTGFSINDQLGLFTHQQPCTGAASDTPVIGTGGLNIFFSDLTDLETTQTDGQVKITGLTNDTCVNIRLITCDKFSFCTRASRELEETPETIEALLKKQACFLLTAGFGGEHPIVNFFRAFRDQVLSKYSSGRSFIDIYYALAPQYAPYILNSPKLSALIRGLAYILYGAIKFWPLTLLFFTLSVLLLLKRYSNLFGKRRAGNGRA
jgi:hypothetical protein